MRPALTLLLATVWCAASAPAADTYRVLEPQRSKHRHESPHFVARWNDSDGVKLSDAEIDQGLATLESIRTFYLERVGFTPPYEKQAAKFKININLSNKGWASGSGTGHNDPAMWLHFNAFKDRHALAHEFAHCLQFGALGMRDSPYVGWFWESHAEWMTHQMYPDTVGCSDQLVNAPHLYYGSTRNRYGNWQFWEYLKDTFGFAAVNQIWSKSKQPGERGQALEDPFLVLMRNQNWSVTQLGDQFGRWAARNVTWDYKNGETYRKHYGSYDDRSGARRNRVSVLDEVDPARGRYAIPFYRAPQRYGYNLVRLVPDSTNLPGTLTVRFQGIVQTARGVSRFDGKFENEPKDIPPPASDWRWSVVAVDAQGKPRYSPLQRGAAAQLSFPFSTSDRELWLVVVATPSEHHRISWDQMYYSIYRYPWTVELKGARPAPKNDRPTGRAGARHPNGGGWVDASASVEATAFVGPHAAVLDTARVSGRARIEDRAVVSGSAQVRDQAAVRGHALVTGNSVVAGNARVEEESTVYNGTIEEDARLGALTIIDHPRTRIHGRAEIAAVMNTIADRQIGGTARILGDVELHTSPSNGVFYGFIDQAMIANPRWGADRTEPAREVTAPLPAAPR
jgi:uncharacterized Zn-binding protein involved in type VI secretion